MRTGITNVVASVLDFLMVTSPFTSHRPEEN